MGWMVKIPTASLLGKRPGTYRTGGWVGLTAGLDGRGKSRPAPGFDSWTVHLVMSRYTDCAIPAHSRREYSYKIRVCSSREIQKLILTLLEF